MSYIDGFVMAVPTANKQKFVEHARSIDLIFTELGATRVVECWADDVHEGKITDFGKAVQATEHETVVFSWIEWPDKQTRDAAMKTMIKRPGGHRNGLTIFLITNIASPRLGSTGLAVSQIAPGILF